MTVPYTPRRTVLKWIASAAAGLAVSETLMSCSQQSSPRTTGAGTKPIRVQLAWLKNVEFGGYWNADHAGLYRKYGLSPQWLSGGPNLSSTAAVVTGGQADVAVGDDLETVARDAAAGAEIVVLATVCQVSAGGMLSLPKKPIRTPHDILGKRIGVQQGSTVGLNAILKMHGLPLDYTPVPVGFDPEPLLKGVCDGFVCYVTNQPVTLKLKSIPYVTALYSDMGRPSYGDVIYTSRSYLASHRPELVSFLRASLDGWTSFVANPAASAQLTLSTYGAKLGLDLAQQTDSAEIFKTLMTNSFTQKHGLMAMSLDTVSGPMYRGYRAGGDKNLPDPAKLIDLSVLADARKGATVAR